MISIAKEKLSTGAIPALAFQVATAESPMLIAGQFNAVLGFNYLHMVRNLQATLCRIHALLVPGGLLISKTPCLEDMGPLISQVLLPSLRAIGMAPHVSVFSQAEFCARVSAAGFEILAVENHATKGNDHRPCIVARKRCAPEGGQPAAEVGQPATYSRNPRPYLDA
jgi:hypothetical protein